MDIRVPKIDKPLLLPWRFVWVLLAQVFRLGFCLCIYLMWFNRYDLKRAWKETE